MGLIKWLFDRSNKPAKLDKEACERYMGYRSTFIADASAALAKAYDQELKDALASIDNLPNDPAGWTNAQADSFLKLLKKYHTTAWDLQEKGNKICSN